MLASRTYMIYKKKDKRNFPPVGVHENNGLKSFSIRSSTSEVSKLFTACTASIA
jgi:hypothetical protein